MSALDQPYIRSTDGATMVPIAPGNYVNEAVWKVIGARPKTSVGQGPATP